jgi:CubicO group peptidase (beta-lactamase class C family)
MNQTWLAQCAMGILLLAQAVNVNAGGGSESIAARIQRVEAGLVPAIVADGTSGEKASLLQRMRFYKTPGISIAVINNGVIEWARGYGVLEDGTTKPVTPDTIFQAASISKPVAAMVALRLAEQGKLDLDEDVNRKLVSWQLPENELMRQKKVTLRLLLSHRAGLTDNAGFHSARTTERPPSLRDVLETGKWTPAPIRVGIEPDSRFSYSGGGYCLMEQLLEDVTGKAFPVLARQLVLEPLGMTRSSFEQPLSVERTPNAAVGHRADGKPLAHKWNVYRATSAAGLWSTPTDLARFAIELQNTSAGRSNSILSPAMATEMLTLQGRRDDRDSKRIAGMEGFSDKLLLGRGLGVGLIGDPPLRFYHTGMNPGYQCEMQAYVESGQGAVVMTCADQGWRLGREVLGAIAKEYGWPDYTYEPEIRKIAQVGPDAMASLVGQYRLASEAHSKHVIRITQEAGRLYIEISDHLHKVELYAESETKFFTIEGAMSLTVIKDEAGVISEIAGDQGWRAKRSMGE